MDGHPDMGKDSGELSGIAPNGIPVTSDLAAALEPADCLIDFTLADAVPGNVETAARLGRAVVIGATGLNDEQQAVVEQAASKIPVLWAPNMSLGVNLLFSMVKKAAEILGSDYAIELDETHHVHKKDAPSGTALGLAEHASRGAGKELKQVMVHDENGAEGVHDPEKIVVRSYRKGEVIGDHTVSFLNDTETIEFTHHAQSRDAFAMGALRAASWVVQERPRLYDMLDMLGLS
jgi:4-hydroxy-tetrahydrodipicolinate reductase